jgi:hypothetical protein
MRLLFGKSYSLKKSRAKAHMDERHFKNILYENDLKIINKPNPENLKLHICTMKLSAGLPNLVRLSLSRRSNQKFPIEKGREKSTLRMIEGESSKSSMKRR